LSASSSLQGKIIAKNLNTYFLNSQEKIQSFYLGKGMLHKVLNEGVPIIVEYIHLRMKEKKYDENGFSFN